MKKSLDKACTMQCALIDKKDDFNELKINVK